jgi:hypothetical protein
MVLILAEKTFASPPGTQDVVFATPRVGQVRTQREDRCMRSSNSRDTSGRVRDPEAPEPASVHLSSPSAGWPATGPAWLGNTPRRMTCRPAPEAG